MLARRRLDPGELHNGIIVNIAPNANDPFRSVRIRGLVINGTGASGAVGTRTGLDGIRILQAGSVFVEKTTIQDFSQEGVEVAAANFVNLVLDDVIIRNCGGSGVKLATTSAAIFCRRYMACASTGVAWGSTPSGQTRVLIRESVFALDEIGIQTTGAGSDLSADEIALMRLSSGIVASAGSAVRVADSIITGNVTALNPNGGAIISLGGNSVTNNGSGGTFSSTVGKL